MKMLFLAYRDPLNPFQGGGDIYISEIARGCARKGHQITFISSGFPGSNSEEDADGVHILRCGNRFTLFARIFAIYLRHLRGKFDMVIEEIIGGPRIPFLAGLYMKEPLIGIVQQRHREIFHYQFPFPISRILSLMEPLFGLLYRDRTIVVNSGKTLTELRSIGFNEQQMRVVHPGISEQFHSVTNRDENARGNQVVCLAKARRYKLIDHAILAMEGVCKAIPSCRLVIAGKSSDVDRKYEKHLRELARRLGLSKNIVFLSDIGEAEKVRLLCESKVLVLPSAVEGFGIVVIEANACGTPAVVSDRVPSDAAKNGYNAIVVECGRIDLLSTNIVSLITDKDTWNTMSENAVRWAKMFSWNRTVDEFLRNLGKASPRQSVET